MDIQQVILDRQMQKYKAGSSIDQELATLEANQNAANAAGTTAGNDGYHVGAGSYEGLFSEGLYNIRNAFTGGERREAASAEAAKAAEVQNYNRTRNTLLDTAKLQDLALNQKKVQGELDDKSVARNTAKQGLEAQQFADHLNKIKQQNNTSIGSWLKQGNIELGADGATYTLTEQGKKNLQNDAKFAGEFNGYQDVTQLASDYDAKMKQRQLQLAADTNNSNDFNGSPAVLGLVKNMSNLSEADQAALKEQLTANELALKTKTEGITTNLSASSKHILTDLDRIGDLTKLNQSPVDAWLNNTYKDPEKLNETRDEINSLATGLRDKPEFNTFIRKDGSKYTLSDAEQQYVLAQTASQTKGAGWWTGWGAGEFQNNLSSVNFEDVYKQNAQALSSAIEAKKALENYQKSSQSVAADLNAQYARKNGLNNLRMSVN